MMHANTFGPCRIRPQQIGISLLLSLFLMLFWMGQAEAGASFTTTASFFQGLSLTQGTREFDSTVLTVIIGDGEEIQMIVGPEIDPLFEFSPSIELFFGLTTEAARSVEVVAEHITGLAVVEDTGFEAVTDDLLASLDVTKRWVSIDRNDLVVLLTEDDRYIILGDVTRHPGANVTFTYLKVGEDTGEIPEPATLLLVGTGLIGAIGMVRRKRKETRSKGGNFMKHLKTLVFALVAVSLLVGIASAAELRVMKTGTGKGMVVGNEIYCGSECKWNYEKKTVVHLKAIPYSNSRFAGWLVNGKPTEGVITIDQEDIIVTAQFESNAQLDDLIIQWYNGPHKEQAIMVLDEVAVFIEPWEKWDITTQDEFLAAVQEITQRFHPQAVVSEQYEDYLLLLKSPEPLEKTQFLNILPAIKALKYVKQVSPVFYRRPEILTSQLILTEQIHVKFPDRYTQDQIVTIEKDYGLVRVEAVSYVTHGFRYRVSDPLKALEVANRLYESGKVEYAYPGWIKEYRSNSRPDDTYFDDQWHLENTGQKGGNAEEDVNILSAWNTTIWNPNTGKSEYIRGSGIVIAIVDDGVELTHEDLAPNAIPIAEKYHYDFIDGDYDPSPAATQFIAIPPILDPVPIEKPRACHGTAVSGVALGASEGNNIGICGAAPQASLAGYRVSLTGATQGITINPNLKGKPGVNADALVQNHQHVHIYNNSWGNREMEKLDPEEINALIDGTQFGRYGLGNIFVFGGGNMPRVRINNQWQYIWTNSNYNSWANSRYVIAVGASNNRGERSAYSELGANLLVNAPSSDKGVGISTTDRSGFEGYNPYGTENSDYPDLNYTKNFGGTSAAAPLVSGIIALVLEAREKTGKPPLTWRDVQQILITTAEKNDSTDNAPGDLNAWKTNGAGHLISHKYGFGRVDATAAVNAALSWQTIPDEIQDLERPRGTNFEEAQIPDNNNAGISKRIPIEKNINIEFVEVYLTADHRRYGDLEVILTSPTGTKSVLAEQHWDTPTDFILYDDWRFGSVQHFGETSKGDWILTIRDKRAGESGKFIASRLKIYGTELPTWTVKTPSDGVCMESGGGVECVFDEGKSSVILRPKEGSTPDIPYVFLPPDDQAGITHTGTYWMPPGPDSSPSSTLEIAVNMAPDDSWLSFRNPSEEEQCWRCPESPDYDPAIHTPDPPSTETKPVDWEVTATLNAGENSCQVKVSWNPQGSDATKTVTVEMQPYTVCDPGTMTGTGSGTYEMTATYAWERVRREHYTQMEDEADAWHRVEDTVWPFREKQEQYGWNYLNWENRNGKIVFERENPDWQKAPQSPQTFPIIEPGQEGFEPSQLLSVSYESCAWQQARICRWINLFTGACVGQLSLYLEDDPCETCTYLGWEGWYLCDGTATYAQWEAVTNCYYQETRGFACFSLTATSLWMLEHDGVPSSVADLLRPLQNQRFYAEQAFLEAVQQMIGPADTATYQDRLLNHAYELYQGTPEDITLPVLSRVITLPL